MNKKELIEENMTLVYFLINKYYPSSTHDEDVIQVGMEGLCKAANTWNEELSTFSTYASKCILNSIRTEFCKRKKHQGLLSLDYEVNGIDGTTPFGDLVEGAKDVDFIDVEPVMNKLTPREKEVFAMLVDGSSPRDVTYKFGWSKQRTEQIMRKIRLVWRNYNGDSD